MDHSTHDLHHHEEHHAVPPPPAPVVPVEPAYEVRRVIDRPHPHVKTVYNRHIKPKSYPVHPTLQYGPSVYDK